MRIRLRAICRWPGDRGDTPTLRGDGSAGDGSPRRRSSWRTPEALFTAHQRLRAMLHVHIVAFEAQPSTRAAPLTSSGHWLKLSKWAEEYERAHAASSASGARGRTGSRCDRCARCPRGARDHHGAKADLPPQRAIESAIGKQIVGAQGRALFLI